MIIKTMRYKLDDPIEFTDKMEFTVMIGLDTNNIIVGNGLVETTARPVEGEKEKTDE